MFFDVGSYFIIGGILLGLVSSFFIIKLQNYIEMNSHIFSNNLNLSNPWTLYKKLCNDIKKNPHEFEDKKIVVYVKKIIITRRLAQVIFLAGCLMIIIHLILLP